MLDGDVTEPLTAVEYEAVMCGVVCDSLLLGIDDTMLNEAPEAGSELLLAVTELLLRGGCEEVTTVAG